MRKIEQSPSILIPNPQQERTLRWRDWSAGINSEDDPKDLPLAACAELNNFNIDKRGKITDINGHTAVLSNVPAGLSIERIFQYKVTKPSAQTITIVVGQKSSLWKVYAVNTTLFARPGDVSGWRDMTEYEEFTATDGTGLTTVGVLTTISSEVTDAQKGFFIINLTNGISSIVSGSVYDSGPGKWTLTTLDNIGSTASDDLILMRYPLIGYYAGSATDYDLDVTDVNDISFSLDNENLRINFGSASDQERGFWFGYIDRYLLDGNQNSDLATPNGYNHGGWWCENQEMQRQSANTLSSSVLSAATSVTSDPLPVGDYTFRTSYMYDGNQEGPLMDYDASILDITTTVGQDIQYDLVQYLYLDLPAVGTSPPMYFRNGADINGLTMFMSHRITGLNIYLSNDKLNYYLVDIYTLAADSSTGVVLPTVTQQVTGIKWTARGGEYSARTGFGGYPYIKEDTPTNVMGFCDTQTLIRGRRIVGSMRQPSPEDFKQYIYRIAGAQPHSNGTWQNDVFGITLGTHIDIRTSQADAVMGLEELNGGLVVLKANSLHSINFGSGLTESWTIGVSNENVGAISKRSIERTPNGVIFAGRDNIYIFDGVSTVPIADSWKSTYQAITDSVKAVMPGAYYAKRDQYRIVDPNTSITYVYSLKQRSWITDTSIDAQAYDLVSSPDGLIMWAAGGQIYKMDQASAVNDMYGTLLTSIKDFDPRYTWKLKKVFVTHKGTNTAMNVLIYGNHGATLLDTVALPASATLITNGGIISEIADDIQIKILTSNNHSYNTEIHEIAVTAVPIRKKRAAI